MVLVLNKSDLLPKISPKDIQGWGVSSAVVFSSCLEDKGVEALKQEIFHFMNQGFAGISDEAVVSTVRQKDLLEEAASDLSRAREACAKRLSGEFIASDVRQALDHLGMLVGEVVTDDVLEVLFSKFCIGK